MKKITLLLLLLITSWHIHAQIGIVEGLNSTTLPTGWTQSAFYSTTQTPCEGSHSYRDNFYEYSTTGSLTTKNYVAVSNATNVNVSFQWQATEYTLDSGIGFTVNAEFSINNGVTWQAIGSPISANSITPCNNFSAVIPAASVPMGSDFKFRVSGVWDSGDCYFWIDNISITQTAFNPPACTTLSFPSNGAVDISSTTISWTSAAGIPTGYKLKVGTTSGGTDVLNLFDAGNVLTYNLGILTPATTYYVTVVPYNGIGSATGPCTESSFTTCGPVTTLPWTENFDGLSSVGTNSFPGCWTKENGDWSTAIAGTYNTPRSGANYLRDSWFAANEYIWTKGFNLVAGTSYDFSAFVQGDGGTAWVVDMFYNTSPLSSGATPLGLSYNVPGTGTYEIQSYVEMRRTFVPATSGTYYFAIRVNEPSSDPWYLAFDDFRLETTPTCPAPLNLMASGITPTSAVLSWTESGSATTWNLQYGVTGFVLGSGVVVNGTPNPTVLTGLSPATTYQFYVQADCGSSSLSAWAGPYSFTTGCSSVTSFTQNFDGVSTANFPTCWAKIGPDGSAYLQSYNSNSLPNSLYMNGYGEMPLVKTVAVSNLGAGTHRLKFKMRANYTTGGTIEIGYLTNPAADNTFVFLGTVTANTLTYSQYEFTPPAGAYSDYLAIRHTGDPSDSVNIDDMVWEPIPSCLEPSAITVSAIATTTATVSWTASVTIPTNGYDYYYSTSNTAPTVATVPSGSVGAGITTVNLSGLTSGTIYNVWVRSKCTLTDISAWTELTAFTTVCMNATVPYTQDFESTTVPSMPVCVSLENAGLGNDWVTENNPGYGFTSKALRYTYTYAGDANAWFYTQPITLTAGTSYDISYKYGNNSSSYFENLRVAYGNSASSTSMTNILAEHYDITGAVANQNTVVFTPTTSGNYYFGFNANSASGQYYLYVDDITITASVLGTDSFDLNKLSYYPNPVKNVLNLSYNTEISAIRVFNLLGQEVITKTINASQSQIDMSHLSAGTYVVQVTANDQVKMIKVIKE